MWWCVTWRSYTRMLRAFRSICWIHESPSWKIPSFDRCPFAKKKKKRRTRIEAVRSMKSDLSCSEIDNCCPVVYAPSAFSIANTCSIPSFVVTCLHPAPLCHNWFSKSTASLLCKSISEKNVSRTFLTFLWRVIVDVFLVCLTAHDAPVDLPLPVDATDDEPAEKNIATKILMVQ